MADDNRKLAKEKVTKDNNSDLVFLHNYVDSISHIFCYTGLLIKFEKSLIPYLVKM